MRRDGAALAAIGLETADPAGAAERAESLLAPVRRQRSTGLDAVVAPDGTELSLCAPHRAGHAGWTRGFRAPVGVAGRHGGPPAGITGLDHVALTQPWHQFDEAVLFHRSVLGLRPHESVELADPYGLFHSRALSGDGGEPRLVLNLAPISAAGERAQHVAFRTHDIVAAARRARAAGAGLLPIPDNYYDDLDARHELPAGDLRTYRELGILYDRDEDGGEFRHFYTVAHGQVFFEVVQRTGGYRGYGAANAPIRLAAQRDRRR
jgi:4-hydroxyphenylpyruvate dioxygenase